MIEQKNPGIYYENQVVKAPVVDEDETASTVFLGFAERGPVDEPYLIESFQKYLDVFGGFSGTGHLPRSVYQFFEEGGRRAYVQRVVRHENGIATSKFAETVSTPIVGLNVVAASPGSWANPLENSLESGLQVELRESPDEPGSLRVSVYHRLNTRSGIDFSEQRILVENFNDLLPVEVQDVIANKSKYIRFETLDTGLFTPPVGDEIINIKFDGGDDGLWDQAGEQILVGSEDFLGNGKESTFGLPLLNALEDIDLLVLPDAIQARDEDDTEPEENLTFRKILKGASEYCDVRDDIFLIMDPPEQHSASLLREFKLEVGLNSPNGALYYPWLLMRDPVSGESVSVPPSGAVAGVFAASDESGGVQKAPAGPATGKLKSITGLIRNVTAGEVEALNPIGINPIRSFPSHGPIIWGARTLSREKSDKYINVRRLYLDIKKSAERTLREIIFEPQTLTLRALVTRSMMVMLSTYYQEGAFVGESEEDAFIIKTDYESNSDVIKVEIGFAPAAPAEFIFVRLVRNVK